MACESMRSVAASCGTLAVARVLKVRERKTHGTLVQTASIGTQTFCVSQHIKPSYACYLLIFPSLAILSLYDHQLLAPVM